MTLKRETHTYNWVRYVGMFGMYVGKVYISVRSLYKQTTAYRVQLPTVQDGTPTGGGARGRDARTQVEPRSSRGAPAGRGRAPRRARARPMRR